MASTRPEPLPQDPAEWIGRRVTVETTVGERKGMVQDVRLTPDGALASINLQLPAGNTLFLPANGIGSVEADGWSEALSQANLDFQLGEGRG